MEGLLAGCSEFKLIAGSVLTEDLEGEEKIGSITVKYVPLWKWLLGVVP